MTHSIIPTAEQGLYLALLERAKHRPIANEWLANLPKWLGDIKDKRCHAHAPKYAAAVEKLPDLVADTVDLSADTITIAAQLSDSKHRQIIALMRQLMPWRKGPFQIGTGERAVHIDTEWRSDMKWQRIALKLTQNGISLTDRYVLDVGGGSGYHGWRMLGAGAKEVIVIDPSCLFYHQFMAIRHFIDGRYGNQSKPLDHDINVSSSCQDKSDKRCIQHSLSNNSDVSSWHSSGHIHFIPAGLEELPSSRDAGNQLFDVVFCMGVLYHRASPFEHLQHLKDQLQTGGWLILETLVVEGDEMTVLVPKGRYAKMNNVYFLPSVPALTLWLQKVGFDEVRCIDVSVTTTDEQRATQWMDYQSLSDFLDPADPSITIEGHPAPTRATLVARR